MRETPAKAKIYAVIQPVHESTERTPLLRTPRLVPVEEKIVTFSFSKNALSSRTETANLIIPAVEQILQQLFVTSRKRNTLRGRALVPSP